MTSRVQVLEIYDRLTGKDAGAPIAHLLLERDHTTRIDDRDGSTYEASITLRYRRILGKLDHRSQSVYQAGSFVGVYQKLHGRVSLTSGEVYGGGGVFLDPAELRGQRIGTYLMNQVVTWAKQWPEAEVKPITLNASDATSDNKARRNKFYEQFNIAFDYDEGCGNASGRSRIMRAADLTPVDTWAFNIVERPLLDYVASLVHDRELAVAELEARDKAVRELGAMYSEALNGPVRWATKTLLGKWR